VWVTTTPRNTAIETFFALIKLQTAQVSETLSACVGQAKHPGIELSYKFWDWSRKTGTNNRKHHFPPRKSFLFKSTLQCPCQKEHLVFVRLPSWHTLNPSV